MDRTKEPVIIQSIRQECDPEDFELLVAALWEKLGWQTDHVGGRGDGGRDIIARQTNPVPVVQVIQAKLYSDAVGCRTVRNCASQLLDTGVDCSILVTTSFFTSGAEKTANQYGVKLVDGRKLSNLLASTDPSWLSRHLSVVPDRERWTEPHSTEPPDGQELKVKEVLQEAIDRSETVGATRSQVYEVGDEYGVPESELREELEQLLRDSSVKKINGDQLVLV